MRNISGQKFGSLTAVRITGKVGRAAQWEFLCDCGNTKVMRASNAGTSKGKISSCGCETGREDLVGRIFGRLEVICRDWSKSINRSKSWVCKCSCGNRVSVISAKLKAGQKSCGCIIGEHHGESNTPEYRTWGAMIGRCYNKNTPNYIDYGGRGITVCDEWRESYLMFLGHIGRRPSAEHSIDRIDNDGNYEPGNVRWTTASIQNSNKRSRQKVESDRRKFSK